MIIGIRSHPHINGIPAGVAECLVTLYADDLLVTVTNPETGVPHLLKCIEAFGNLLVNTDKLKYILCPPFFFFFYLFFTHLTTAFESVSSSLLVRNSLKITYVAQVQSTNVHYSLSYIQSF